MNTIIRIITSLAIIALAMFGFKALKASKKAPKAKVQNEIITTVDVIKSKLATHSTEIKTFGTVRSRFETKIAAQVSGKIIELSTQFDVGKRVKAGETLAVLDPTDYEAILAQLKANLTIAQRSLDEEEIRAQQARQDWVASGRKLSKASDFVLRKPQLSAARATIDATKATIEKAEADIERTKITAPFDAIVSSRNVALGDFSTPQIVLGNLISSDEAEIYLPLTPEQGLRVRPTADTKIILDSPALDPSQARSATFSRYAPTVDSRNQVSYLIATISDPYGENPLPIGTFVNATIPAEKIEDAYKIPESALVNDAYIWMVKDGTLVKHNVKRLHTFSDGNLLVRTGDELSEEISVISRPLSTFQEGMKVKIAQPQSDLQSQSRNDSSLN